MPAGHDHGASGHDGHHAGDGASAALVPEADPLAGPGRVSTVRIGPIPLLPSVNGLDLSALESPALPIVLPGHLNLPMIGIWVKLLTVPYRFLAPGHRGE